MIAVSDASFEADVLTGGLTLVYCWATWCGPCKLVGPAVEELDYPGLTVAKLDVAENPATPAQYGVGSLPALLLFRDGELVQRRIGPIPRFALRRMVEAELG